MPHSYYKKCLLSVIFMILNGYNDQFDKTKFCTYCYYCSREFANKLFCLIIYVWS